MNYIVSASTDVGIAKDKNEDSLFVRIVNTCQGRMVFAAICDGMGGHEKGELASASLLNAFTDWMHEALPALVQRELEDADIYGQWANIITSMNAKIMRYGMENRLILGTTALAMLLTCKRYYIINVGDGRVYEIAGGLKQITRDQTVVANDLANGLITQKQAETDPRRNVLLQSVGACKKVVPDFFTGRTLQNAVYMLCSDGFRHMIKPLEIHNALQPSRMNSVPEMQAQMEALIELNKQRKEEDNISAITIRTY